MTDEGLGQRAAMAYVAAMVIDWLKRTNWVPWINHNTDKLNRVVSIVAAIGQTAGFNFIFEGTLDAGGILHVSIPSLSAIVHFATDSVYTFAAQEFAYKVAMKPRAVEGVPVPEREYGAPAPPAPPPVVVSEVPAVKK